MTDTSIENQVDYSCPRCGEARVLLLRDWTVAVDVDFSTATGHFGHVCPAIDLRDRARVHADGRVEWVVIGELVSISCGDVEMVGEASAGTFDALIVAGGETHLGSEHRLVCPCGWNAPGDDFPEPWRSLVDALVGSA